MSFFKILQYNFHIKWKKFSLNLIFHILLLNDVSPLCITKTYSLSHLFLSIEEAIYHIKKSFSFMICSNMFSKFMFQHIQSWTKKCGKIWIFSFCIASINLKVFDFSGYFFQSFLKFQNLSHSGMWFPHLYLVLKYSEGLPNWPRLIFLTKK